MDAKAVRTKRLLTDREVCGIIVLLNFIQFISSCLEKLVTKNEKQMKLTRFLFSRRFEVILTPLSSDK